MDHSIVPIFEDAQEPEDAVAEIRRLKHEIAERDDLLALAAHELRNPLHALALHLSLARVLAESHEDSGVAERLRKAETALKRYAERVTVLLELLAAPEAPYPLSLRELDLSSTLRSLVEGLFDEARVRGIDLRVDVPERCTVRMDPVAIEQVVDNLLLNAFKHSAASAVTVRLRCEGAWGCIEVADNGRGIAPEDQAAIFRKFGVAVHSERGPGRGLGLWIVRRLLDALDGRISLESAPGQGCLFKVRFPLREALNDTP